MADQAEPTRRLVEQRLRNRIIEALETLAAGDDGVRSVGNGDYINNFDMIEDGWSDWRGMSTLTVEEVDALNTVRKLVLSACEQSPRDETDEAFIRAGWPSKIAPPAGRTLQLMEERGRFDEQIEEDEPARRI